MSDVALDIGGRHYRVACAPGEEERIVRLGRLIDGKLASEPGLANQSEPRMLLFAALLLADQLDEMQRGRPAASAPPPAAPANDAEAEALEHLAARLETIAGQLEEAVASA